MFAHGGGLDEFEFEFVTNRLPSRRCEEWINASGKSARELVALIQKSSGSKVPDVQELASVLEKLGFIFREEGDLQNTLVEAGSSFGMLQDEIASRVDELVGLLLRKAGSDGRRIVHRNKVLKALTGEESPWGLRCEESVGFRQVDVEKYKRRETNGLATIPRRVSEDIAQAVFQHPLTIVTGEGGVGKSVAVCDAISAGLRYPTSAPGFGLILRATETSAESVMRLIANWRNFSRNMDGQDFSRSIRRLRRAFADSPLLVVCIDAIDERKGEARLPDRVQRFIEQLIGDAEESHKAKGIPEISVVLTCRNEKELRNLGCPFGFLTPFHHVMVGPFDDGEVNALSAGLDKSVRNRILAQLSDMPSRFTKTRTSTIWDVAPDVSCSIRHPVVWRFFAELDASTQHDCLSAEPDGLDILAEKFLEWFQIKSEGRISGLSSSECPTAMAAVAKRFRENPARIGDRSSDWIAPSVSVGCSEVHASQLLVEVITAGIVESVESDGRRWRWRHTWLCQYLLRKEIRGI